MQIAIVVLSVLGFAAVLFGAISAYTGRMREDPPGSHLYKVSASSASAMWIAIAGGVVGLAAALLAVLPS